MASLPRLLGGNVPTMAAPASYQKDLESILPGISSTLGQNLGNISDLISGTESPSITQNMNAYWGVNSGLAPGSEFLRNRAVDLYGQRSAARKEQGGQDLLALLGGVSGPLAGYRGQDIGLQTAREAQTGETQRQAERLGQQESEFARDYSLRGELGRGQLGVAQGDLDLRRLLGIGNLNLNTLQSYLQYLS